MADAESSPAPTDAFDFGAFGYSLLSIPQERTMSNLYGKLSRDQRTWRCEQMKKSADLMDRAWELLRPIAEGHWDKDKAYTGLALFLKAMYEGQGYAVLQPDLINQFREIMRGVQENMMYVNSGGRRVQADDNPARFALRVGFTSLVLLTATSMSYGTEDQQPGRREKNEEVEAQAFQMAVGCLDKLGGPLSHEGSLTGEERAHLARLATGPAAGADVQRLVDATPLNVLTIYMLQAQYDIELRVVKWVLHYVATRCAKEAYSRARSALGGSGGGGSASASNGALTATRSAWISHSRALGKLDPGNPLGVFMAAEARASVEDAQPETLAAMRGAAAAAERRGDDMLAWLARLNVAQLIVNGGQGATFREEDVLLELDIAAGHKASAKRWGGDVLVKARCQALMEAITKDLQMAHEQRQKQLAEAGAGVGSGAGSATEEAAGGRLLCVKKSGQWAVLTNRAVAHRECAGCKKLYHKALACGRCKAVWYCGRDCQLAHWKAGHKAECAALAAAAAAKASDVQPPQTAAADNTDD